MSLKPNRAYNNPELGAVFNSVASMFGPPDSGELVNYAQARGLNQKADIIEQLKGDPRYQGADGGVLAGLFNPTQSWRALDMGDATARRGQDIDAATSRENNVRDSQRAFVTSTFQPLNQGQVRPAIPAGVGGFFGVGGLPAVQGNPKPMSETEVKGSWLQELLDSGKLTPDDVATQYRSDTNVEEVLGLDGKPMFVTRGAAVGMQPAPKTPLVTVGAGEKAWDTESAKLFAQRYDQISTQADVASEMLSLLGAAEQALSSGVYQGIGAEQLLDLQRLGTALGVENTEQVAGGELIRAIQNRMALLMRNPESGMGMPGAVSDRDIQFLKAAQPGLSRTPEGNRQMLQMLAKMEQRKIEVAQMADAYIAKHGRLDAGFNTQVREYAQANPLFPAQAPASGATAEPEVFAVNPQTGERMVYRGGRWQAAE